MVRQWGGGDGTRASKGGRGPGNCRELATIPPEISLSSITRIPYRDLTTFLYKGKDYIYYKISHTDRKLLCSFDLVQSEAPCFETKRLLVVSTNSL